LFWSKGFAAEETKAAFIRAQELAAGIADAAERFPTYYGLWVGGLLRGAVFEYLGKIKGIWRAVPATRLMVVKPCCSRLDL
jgi:hypothetical protein